MIGFGALGADEVSVQRATLITADRYGKSSRDWPDAATHTVTGVSVQPVSVTEAAVDREYAASHLVLFAPAGADIEATDRVTWRGTQYEVDGPPKRWIDDAGVDDHLEVSLKLMTG